MYLTRAHKELVNDVAACKNEMQVIDILHERRHLVDGIFLSLFLDPGQNDFALQKLKPEERFHKLTKLVQEQYSRNLIDEYLRTPKQHIPSYVRPVIRVLILEYSFNYLSSLLTFFENDELQLNFITERFGNLIGIAVDYLISLEDENKIKEVLYAGPAFFINDLVIDLLNTRAGNDSLYKNKCIYLIQCIADYKGRFPIEKINNQRLFGLLNTFYSIRTEEEKIAILQKALSMATNESAHVISNLQYLIGCSYLERLTGPRHENLRLAINCLNNALHYFTEKNDLYRWSAVQNGLGRAYVFWQEGVASENIEKSIWYFNNALKGFTKNEAPYDWALQQNNLGAAYLERVRGNKVNNIERAVGHFQEALTIQTPDFTPGDWAMTMMNLGDAFNNKYGAEKLESAQKAIGFYKEALNIYTLESNPVKWAKVQAKIGDAYHTLAANNRAENLKKAFEHVSDALTVLNPTLAPQEWEIAVTTLAKIYLDRIDGERVENIEQAILLYKSVLQVNKKEQAPYSWAINLLNLAHCYRVRLRGTSSENQKLAISYLNQTLQVLNKEHFPIDWASVQHLLGILYYDRIASDKADDYERSIEYFESALEVRKWENVPNSWIESMNSLGNSHRKRLLGNASKNIENAINCFIQVIVRIDPTTNPILWAIVYYNTGLSYRDRPTGDREENYAKAIACFKKALTVHTPVMNPIECFKTSANLGKLYYSIHAYADSKSTLELCHQSIENMRAQSAREFSRRQLASESANVYEVLVASCIMTGDIEDAFYYTTAAKARLFIDKLGGEAKQPSGLIKDDNPEFAVEWAAIEQIRLEIDQLTRLQQGNPNFVPRENPVYGSDLGELIAEKRASLSHSLEKLFYNFPQLTLNHDAPIAKPDALKQLSATLGKVPLVEYYQSSKGWGAFVVFGDEIRYIGLPGVSKELVESIAFTMFVYEQGVMDGQSQEQFINRLAISLGKLYDHFLRPLESYLPSDGPLVLALSQDLHMLPFTIAYDEKRYRYLVDQFSVSYMPSLGALENLYRRWELCGSVSKDLSLLSVVYSAYDSAKPLRYALKEAKKIALHFLPEPYSVCLHEQDATPARVLEICDKRQFNTFHFACHGQFDVNDPANSGLLLKAGLLTTERIATELRQSLFPTVILNACQSGISFSQDGDEAIGLIQSFFSAGAGCVISGQWSVEDKTTQVLFEHFFENRKSMNSAEALRQAMITIRKNQHWNSPIYWAPFKVMGIC